MKIREANFIPVLLGSDINTYSMARAFHEAYKIRSFVIGKRKGGPSINSKIVSFRAVPGIEEEEVFLEIMRGLAKEHPGKKLLLFGCGDDYITLIIKNKHKLPDNFITVYIDYDMLPWLIEKEKFYELCQKYSLAYPKTFVYQKDAGTDYALPFGFPVILKPSDSVSYWHHPFPSQKKVYKLPDQQSLDTVICEIYGAGYDSSLIIQDFIPGDDSNMRVLTSYSDRNGRVVMMALGHVLLEEHTPKGIGNHALIINDYNEALLETIKIFLEKIGYIGFSNFDIKYDPRDNTYKVLELNARQGRSNFYITGAGCNIAEYVVNDRIYNKETPFTIVKNKVLWLVIPKRVAFRYVRSPELRAEMRSLIKAKKIVNPLFYRGDLGFKRLSYLFISHVSHFWKYRKYHA